MRSSIPNKYLAHAQNGFPSKLEESVYNVLLFRQQSGEIKDIKRQQPVTLLEGNGEKITWKLDFSFNDQKTGELKFAEAKGFATEGYALKLRMWKVLRPHPLEIWTGTYKKPTLKETIR